MRILLVYYFIINHERHKLIRYVHTTPLRKMPHPNMPVSLAVRFALDNIPLDMPLSVSPAINLQSPDI